MAATAYCAGSFKNVLASEDDLLESGAVMKRIFSAPFYLLAIVFACIALCVHTLAVFIKEIAQPLGAIGDWISK